MAIQYYFGNKILFFKNTFDLILTHCYNRTVSKTVLFFCLKIRDVSQIGQNVASETSPKGQKEEEKRKGKERRKR